MPLKKGRRNGGTFKKGQRGGPGRPKGIPNKVSQEAKSFCEALVSDPTYQEKFKAAFIARTLTPRLEEMVWHYAKGRPPQSVELAGHDGEPITFEIVTNVPDHAD